MPPLVGEPITFEHYQYPLNNTLVVEWAINAFIIAAGVALLVVVIGPMIALSLTQLDWPG